VTTQAPKKTRTKTTKTAAKNVERDDGSRWLRELELSLLQFHQVAAQRRGFRAGHRMPFVQCRQCDELRREAIASKQQEQQAPPS
jgi:hypothetical protein